LEEILQILLEIKDITVYYGQIEVLKNVSIELFPNEIACLIGSNGAGKSTLIKSISGLIPLRKGSIFFDGTDVSGLSADKRVRLGIIQVPERRLIISSLSVIDNLMLGTFHHYRISKKESLRKDFDYVFDLFPILKERQRQQGGTLSGGEQQMLAIGRGLLARPKLLMLDEPSLGLAPMIVAEVFSIIKKLQEQHIAIFLIEQNAKAALQISNRGFVIEIGHIILKGHAKELVETKEVRDAYLGRRM
jgi:branched-chain amino acid transport system ATP-binding protein